MKKNLLTNACRHDKVNKLSARQRFIKKEFEKKLKKVLDKRFEMR